mgnify:CR=1 FL=1
MKYQSGVATKRDQEMSGTDLLCAAIGKTHQVVLYHTCELEPVDILELEVLV